jgi:hypothetical protein
MGTPHDRRGGREDSQPTTTYHAEWDDGGDGELSTTVVTAVADAMDARATDLEPLSRRLDPDALDGLFAGDADGDDCRVAFRFNGYDVTVYADGHVVVTDAPRAGQTPTR